MTLMSEPMVRSSVLNFTASRCHERLQNLMVFSNPIYGGGAS